MTETEVKIIIGLLGFLGGIIPFILTYIKNIKRETASAEKRFFEQVTKAEDKLREDLMKQIATLQQEMKDMKTENRSLHAANIRLEKRVSELEIVLTKHNITYRQVGDNDGYSDSDGP